MTIFSVNLDNRIEERNEPTESAFSGGKEAIEVLPSEHAIVIGWTGGRGNQLELHSIWEKSVENQIERKARDGNEDGYGQQKAKSY